MPRQRKVRVVLMAPPSLVLRYEKLAKKFEVSRSELMRLTLQRGLSSTEAWCRKRAAVVDDLDDPQQSKVAVAAAIESASMDNRGDQSPVGALDVYARAIVSQRPDMDDVAFRTLISTHASAVGMSPASAEPFIEELVRRTFPRGGAAAAAPSPSSDSASDVDGEIDDLPDSGSAESSDLLDEVDEDAGFPGSDG